MFFIVVVRGAIINGLKRRYFDCPYPCAMWHACHNVKLNNICHSHVLLNAYCLLSKNICLHYLVCKAKACEGAHDFFLWADKVIDTDVLCSADVITKLLCHLYGAVDNSSIELVDVFRDDVVNKRRHFLKHNFNTTAKFHKIREHNNQVKMA